MTSAHETIMLVVTRVTEKAADETLGFYNLILDNLRLGYEDVMLAQLEKGKILLTLTEALDLEPDDIRLPVRIREVHFNDGILDPYTQYEVWVDVKEAPRPNGYIRTLNRMWKHAEELFRIREGVKEPT